jgi:hypothetical protein
MMTLHHRHSGNIVQMPDDDWKWKRTKDVVEFHILCRFDGHCTHHEGI